MTIRAADCPPPNNSKDSVMFKTLFQKRRRNYQWKPAIDTSNPRIAASLTTFPTN